jgi:hypothetical protein
MPRCLNDAKATYTGKEPSPKGLGYCAHSEKVGTKKKGRDGNMWIIREVAGGHKRWTLLKANNTITKNTKSKKKSNTNTKEGYTCHDIVRYSKKMKKLRYCKSCPRPRKEIDGIETKPGYILKLVSATRFAKRIMKIPRGFKKTRISAWDRNYYCRKWSKQTKEKLENSRNIHKGCKVYFTRDQGDPHFAVCVKGGKVRVYREDLDQDPPEDFYDNPKKYSYYFSKKVCTFENVKKVFVGKDPNLKQKDLDGNSILLHLGGLQYIFIGTKIYEFTAYASIKQHISPVGNYLNYVVYPYARDSEDNYYLMVEDDVIKVSKDLLKKYKNDPYGPYYKQEAVTRMPFKNKKIIKK